MIAYLDQVDDAGGAARQRVEELELARLRHGGCDAETVKFDWEGFLRATVLCGLFWPPDRSMQPSMEIQTAALRLEQTSGLKYGEGGYHRPASRPRIWPDCRRRCREVWRKSYLQRYRTSLPARGVAILLRFECRAPDRGAMT